MDYEYYINYWSNSLWRRNLATGYYQARFSAGDWSKRTSKPCFDLTRISYEEAIIELL